MLVITVEWGITVANLLEVITGSTTAGYNWVQQLVTDWDPMQLGRNAEFTVSMV